MDMHFFNTSTDTSHKPKGKGKRLKSCPARHVSYHMPFKMAMTITMTMG